MDTFIIAAADALTILWLIAQVAIGLGMVIFVHELGHFAVAKACGVKCEKFYVGFDVPIKLGPIRLPAALWRKQWGETEYGIGILPLGGYVKMLGQDDNPGKIAEEMQRSQIDDSSNAKQVVGPDGETYLIDRRSYLAKSVPQRMAIISAGVVMNVIFAFVFAVIAYGVGVPTIPSVVSHTSPGSPAWSAGLRPGDEVVAIGDKKNPTFEDLRSNVTLGDLETGVTLDVRQAGDESVREVTLKPRRGQNRGLARVGIAPPFSLRLADEYPTFPFSAAFKANRVNSGGDGANKASDGDQGLQGGDEIIAVNGTPVTSYREFTAMLAENRDKEVLVTVRRDGKVNPDDRFAPTTGGRELIFRIDPTPLRRLGLKMEKAPTIAAVQHGSPAAEKDVRVDDIIESLEVNGKTDHDYISLPYELAQYASSSSAGPPIVTLRTDRKPPSGEPKPTDDKQIPLRQSKWEDLSFNEDAPVSLEALGIAVHVVNRIDEVFPGSPAEKALKDKLDSSGEDLAKGYHVTEAEFILGDDEKRDRPDLEEIQPLLFNKDARNWVYLIYLIQDLSPESKVRLTLRSHADGDGDSETGNTIKIDVKPYVPKSSDGQPMYFRVDRGFNLLPQQRMREAENFGDQIAMGYEKTTESLTLVYRFLHKLFSSQVPVTALGGPITIAKASYYSAFDGFGKLLVFLTILSANLAVINFLPIPLLDGGHMVLLAYEGIRRRPPNEKFVIAMQTVGFVFIISLMLFVIVLDLGLLKRNL